MKSIIVHDDEVRALLKTGTVEVVRRMRRQPAHGVSACAYSRTGWAETTADGACTCRPWPCPFTPGQTRWVKEAWRTWFGDIIYRATPPESELINFERMPYGSAVHMPREASRKGLTVECNAVRPERRDGAWYWIAEYKRLEA